VFFEPDPTGKAIFTGDDKLRIVEPECFREGRIQRSHTLHGIGFAGEEFFEEVFKNRAANSRNAAIRHSDIQFGISKVLKSVMMAKQTQNRNVSSSAKSRAASRLTGQASPLRATIL